MLKLPHLFANNRAWAKRMLKQDREFFRKLTQQHIPRYLWIGCSDSRVPSNTIIGLPPGEVFVQRNIANLVSTKDLNALSVIQFAVDVLKVRHIIVCGHYECAGVRAVIDKKRFGLVNQWLKPLAKIQAKYAGLLKAYSSDKDRAQKLCELSVVEQVLNVCQTPSVRSAWKKHHPLTIHGWVYSIRDGLLRDLLHKPIESFKESRALKF